MINNGVVLSMRYLKGYIFLLIILILTVRKYYYFTSTMEMLINYILKYVFQKNPMENPGYRRFLRYSHINLKIFVLPRNIYINFVFVSNKKIILQLNLGKLTIYSFDNRYVPKLSRNHVNY